MSDALREAFEAYFADSRRGKGASKAPTFARLADGTYADDPTQRHWWTWQHAARAALSAPPPAVPAGWQLAPVKATEAMRMAPANDRPGFSPNVAREIWDAMIAAAPQAPTGGAE